jgi:hypothetical protein
MSTTIADPALCAHAQPARKFLTIFAVWCTMIVAGCARSPVQHDFNLAFPKLKAARVRVTARPNQCSEPTRYAEPQIRRLDPALLAPQRAPDCEYKRSDLKTVDPDEWARLKTEYELQCYRDAEEVARVRLGLLQASSSKCEIEPARQRISFRQRSSPPKKRDAMAATCFCGRD